MLSVSPSPCQVPLCQGWTAHTATATITVAPVWLVELSCSFCILLLFQMLCWMFSSSEFFFQTPPVWVCLVVSTVPRYLLYILDTMVLNYKHIRKLLLPHKVCVKLPKFGTSASITRSELILLSLIKQFWRNIFKSSSPLPPFFKLLSQVTDYIFISMCYQNDWISPAIKVGKLFQKFT